MDVGENFAIHSPRPKRSARHQGTKALFSRLASYCHQAEAVCKAPGITFHCLCSVPGPPHCRLSTYIWQQPGHQSTTFTLPQPYAPAVVIKAIASRSNAFHLHLIVSTTQHSSEIGTEIKFAVHDCPTGFHVGDFSVPFDPSHFPSIN
ncbi:hypothetical protein Pelo_18472 [Pelomyxa schiedti]|nr:hypothetical protein Pelo_18472 [Pelomyxa schiedti]